jgi:hypothetical protein
MVKQSKIVKQCSGEDAFSKTVLLELVHLMGEIRNEMVIIGGWTLSCAGRTRKYRSFSIH